MGPDVSSMMSDSTSFSSSDILFRKCSSAQMSDANQKNREHPAGIISVGVWTCVSLHAYAHYVCQLSRWFTDLCIRQTARGAGRGGSVSTIGSGAQMKPQSEHWNDFLTTKPHMNINILGFTLQLQTFTINFQRGSQGLWCISGSRRKGMYVLW